MEFIALLNERSRAGHALISRATLNFAWNAAYLESLLQSHATSQMYATAHLHGLMMPALCRSSVVRSQFERFARSWTSSMRGSTSTRLCNSRCVSEIRPSGHGTSDSPRHIRLCLACTARLCTRRAAQRPARAPQNVAKEESLHGPCCWSHGLTVLEHVLQVSPEGLAICCRRRSRSAVVLFQKRSKLLLNVPRPKRTHLSPHEQ